MTDCVFCAIVAGTAPSAIVASDEDSVSFLDIKPATTGHTLVVPRRHADDLFALTDDEAAAMGRATLNTASLLRAALEPEGMNTLQCNGAAAFQTVFHLHTHVIPRWFTDGVRAPWTPRPGDPAALREVAQRIRGTRG